MAAADVEIKLVLHVGCGHVLLLRFIKLVYWQHTPSPFQAALSTVAWSVILRIG
jgi:hypothetical protein